MTELGVMRQLDEPPETSGDNHPQTVSDPDAGLVAAIARGDEAAARTLVDRHLPRIMNLARRVLGNQADAEEVAQDVFLRVWKTAKAWKPGKAKFETWMHRVALNLCYDRIRKKREVTGKDIPDPIDEGPGPGKALHQKQVAARVDEALQSLPERQRVAITLCHHQGYTNIEAAEMMDVSVEAVESLLARGRRQLRVLLRAELDHLLGEH